MTETRVHTSDADPDREVLQAIRGGDAGAFDQLVLRHQDRIFRLARRLLGDPEEALDAAQETFVRAWRALDRFEGTARFSTWLTRIAINQCRNELRRRRTVKHQRLLSLDEAAPGAEAPRVAAVPGSEPDPWASLRGREVATALQEAMAELSPESREVLLLRDVEDMSYEEMAVVLDVAVGTVRSRLHRARADLRRRMAGVLDA